MRFRRLITMLIAVAMVMTMAVPAFADEDVPTEAPAPVKLTSKQVKAITPKGVKAASYSYTKIKVTWNKIEGVDGYKVYRATSKNGKYTNFFTNKSENKLQVINTKRTTGKTYYYKVRGYKKIGKTTYYTKYSAVTSTYARPSKAVITKVTCPKENCIRIYWNKVSGATGYQVYRSKKGADSWKLYKSVSSKYNYATNYLEGDTKYTNWEYKVRAYRTVNGKKVYGSFSTPAEYIPDWTIDEIYEELWKYGESLAWTEYEYNDDKRNPETDDYLWPTNRKYHLKHFIGWNGKPDVNGDYCVYTNPANGTIYKDSGFEPNTLEGSSWGVLWPIRISRYTSKETILKQMKSTMLHELETITLANPLYWDEYMENIPGQIGAYNGVDSFSMYTEKDKNGYKMWLIW